MCMHACSLVRPAHRGNVSVAVGEMVWTAQVSGLAERKVHISRFGGKHAVVDASTWLYVLLFVFDAVVFLWPICGSLFACNKASPCTHLCRYRGAYSCAREVALGIPTEKFVRFVMHRIKMLQYHKVDVTLVFDGKVLPLKQDTSTQRRSGKKAALSKAKQFEAQARKCADERERGNLFAQADKHFKQAYSPSFAHAAVLMRELRKERVNFIVAPYEADAQLVYM